MSTSPTSPRIQILEPENKELREYLLTCCKPLYRTMLTSSRSGEPTKTSVRRGSRGSRGSFGGDGSSRSFGTDPEEDPDHPEHAQDWTVETKPEDSYANQEVRRRSIWSRIDENNPSLPTETRTERRGSVLSLWRGGKDASGRSILIHDGDQHNEVFEADKDGAPLVKMTSKELARERRLSERRGSILSVWSTGKDDQGRDIIIHDDEEWKV